MEEKEPLFCDEQTYLTMGLVDALLASHLHRPHASWVYAPYRDWR